MESSFFEKTQDEHFYYPQWEGANQVFAIQNCYQNVKHGSANWDIIYCIGKTVEWVNYFLLSILLAFLLSLHCLMYKRINK